VNSFLCSFFYAWKDFTLQSTDLVKTETKPELILFCFDSINFVDILIMK